MKRGLVALVLLVVLGLAGVGWYFAGQALAPGGARAPELDLVVREAGGAQVVVDDTRHSRMPVMGLLYEGGYAQMVGTSESVTCPGDLDEVTDCVRRDVILLAGDLPTVGQAAKADEYAFPAARHDLVTDRPVLDLDIAVSGGTAPAWFVEPAGTDVVAVLVHGRTSDRSEMLRAMDALDGTGFGLLVPSYRGDGDGPAPEGDLGRYGLAEWMDVAQAMLDPRVRTPRTRFVLVGFSQGGAASVALLREADVAKDVDALVLDSPLLSLGTTLKLQARLNGVPTPLVAPVLFSAGIAARIQGFDLGEVELVDDLAALDVPTLLLHGPDDAYVPAGPSQEAALLDPEQIDLQWTPDVDHVRTWNLDPVAYEARLVGFLAGVLGRA